MYGCPNKLVPGRLLGTGTPTDLRAPMTYYLARNHPWKRKSARFLFIEKGDAWHAPFASEKE
jgi:hypothetical protein